MLAGSVPRVVAALADEHYRGFTSKRVFVACSGAFTVERHLQHIGGWSEVHSNDVLLVSEALGGWATGSPLKLKLSPLGEDRVPWLQPYLDSGPDSSLAALACMAQFALSVRAKQDESPYFAKLMHELESQWQGMHGKMRQAIEDNPLTVTSYFSGDVFDYLEQTTSDDAVVSYPPFGGPRDAASRYATDYAKLHPLFEWVEPKYTMLHDPQLDMLYEKIADRRDWLFAVNRRLPAFQDYHRATVQTSNRGTTFEVYASNGPTRIVAPHQQMEPVRIPHISPDDEIDADSDIQLVQLSGWQFSLLRSQYMNHGIRPGSPDLMCGVVVDGKLVGAFAYSFGPTRAVWDAYLPGPHTYLMSDFPVAHSRYDRLAKLVVAAAITSEATELVRRRGQQPFRAMTTTAFSKNPVSMKYRGVLDLIRRRQNDILDHASFAAKVADDPYYNRPYDLQYGSILGERTLNEALTWWVTKHAGAVRRGLKPDED